MINIYCNYIVNNYIYKLNYNKHPLITIIMTKFYISYFIYKHYNIKC